MRRNPPARQPLATFEPDRDNLGAHYRSWLPAPAESTLLPLPDNRWGPTFALPFLNPNGLERLLVLVVVPSWNELRRLRDAPSEWSVQPSRAKPPKIRRLTLSDRSVTFSVELREDTETSMLAGSHGVDALYMRLFTGETRL